MSVQNIVAEKWRKMKKDRKDHHFEGQGLKLTLEPLLPVSLFSLAGWITSDLTLGGGGGGFGGL